MILDFRNTALYTSLHGVASQKTIILIFKALKASDLISTIFLPDCAVLRAGRQQFHSYRRGNFRSRQQRGATCNHILGIKESAVLLARLLVPGNWQTRAVHPL
jgi:hypothetical protein